MQFNSLRAMLSATTALMRAGRVAFAGFAISGAMVATPAWADCTPVAANGVTATCSGATTNQGGGAPGTSAGTDGYGTGVETGVTLNVTSGGANTVTGANNGIFLGDATVINGAGASITGGAVGILANTGSANVTNSGSITGSSTYGIYANTDVTVVNNAGGSITAPGNAAIYAANGSAYVINSGIIDGHFGVHANINATVTNNAGAQINDGIIATVGSAYVTNSGSIQSTSDAINASTSVVVTNNTGGSITAQGFGIRGNGGGSSVFNAGTISGGFAAIQFQGPGNTLTLAQGSVITGGVWGSGNDTFQLGGTAAATFDVSTLGNTAQYRGFGTFNKIDSSVWTLTGTSTFAGDVNVNGGALVVNGNIAASSGVTVNAGILAGSGRASAVQVNAGGTFAPGNGTPGSSMTVASLAFQSGALYAVSLNPSTASFANVTGNASLGGASVSAMFTNVGGYVQKQYTILNAGSITGTFDPTVVNTNLPSGFHTSLSYDPTNTKVFLDLALDILPPTPPSQNGANTNQRNVANAVTNFFNTTGSIPMAFGALTPNGLTQVSGEVGTSGQHANFQASTQFMNVMGDVSSAGRGGVGDAGGAAGYADEGMAYAGKSKSKNPRDAFAAFTKAPSGAAFDQRWNVWAAGYGGSQTTDGNAVTGSNNATSNIYGVAVGADYRFSPDTVAGFALAGGGTNYSVANGGSGRSDMFQAGAFVRQNFGATYLTASAAYGWQDVTTDRYVTAAGVDHLRAEFNTNSYSGRVELGHRFLAPWFGGLGVSPYAAVQATVFELPAYAERAISGTSLFALSYGADTSTATRSELGLRTDKSYALDGAVLTLRGRAAWAHDFNPDSAVTATFQTLPGASFVVNGAALASDSALTTASAEVRWLNGWSVAATFEGEFSDVTRSYAGKGVVRYSW